MDFQAGLEAAISQLVEGALDISRKLLSGELTWETKNKKKKRKAKAKAKAFRPSLYPYPKKPKKTAPRAIKAAAKVPPVIGEKWIRRDGTEPREILAVDETYVTVASDRLAEGTLVKTRDFHSRYKPWTGK